jgi:NodT family efflux transporter outer membrane factor (OMF) lipoprotein
MIRARHLALLAPLALAACAGDQPRPGPLPIAPAWRAANAAPRATEAAGWWQSWGDPVLDALVAQALAANPRIDGAEARIAQARALARRATADLLPVAQGNAQVARVEQSTVAGLGTLTRYLPTYSRTQNDASMNVAGQWELDFARGLSHRRLAAQADAGAALAGARAVRLAVAAETVNAYLDYRAAQAQLATAEARSAALADQLAIARARAARGESAAQQTEATMARDAATRAVLAQRRAALDMARERLAVLTGQPAGTPLPQLAAAGPIPLAPDPSAGTPATLLRARPDLVMAEADLAGAHARVGAALAEYWPHITLSGLIGFDSSDFGAFASPASRLVQGAAGLRWRLFDFARVNAEVAAARGRRREALAAYRDAVLQAGGQVEMGFTQLGAARVALEQQQAAEAAARRAYASAEAAARRGEISRDTLRAAELSRIEAEDALTAARLGVAQAVLACQRALGGG